MTEVTTPAKRRSGRGKSLSRNSIVRAGMEIADLDGLDAVSMRSVARKLGVEAMSLYHHVSNKDEVLDGMVDAVFAEFHTPQIGGDWVTEMRTRSEAARGVLKGHPWAIGLLDSRRGAGFETIRHHDAVLGCLRSAGFSLALTAHAFALLDAHLYGFLTQELSLPFEGEADLSALADAMIAALPEGQLPFFREFTLDYALQPGYDFGAEFEIGLDLILEGLAARLAAESI
jgi:AcrR family transcriptional regulator